MRKAFLVAFFGGLALGFWPSVGGANKKVPTFSKEVVRIFQQNCQACHHPGYIAPFSLMTYEEAKPYARAIKEAVLDGRMPPWKAAQGCGDFYDARILSAADKQTIVDWVDAGAPEGDPRDLPEPIEFPGGWMLGEPQVELKSPEAFRVPPTGNDIYRCFRVSEPFTEDRYVTAAEILPDKAAVTHHVLLFIDSRGDSVALDERDEGPGYNCFGGPGFVPNGGLGGWAPGNFPRFAPEGIATKVPKGARVVMQVHYHPNGTEQLDQTRVGLHFSDKPVNSNLSYLPIFNFTFQLQPGNKNQKVTASLILPFDIKVIGVTPHMHLLGKQMKIEARLPNGKRQCLVNVPKWDFRWQGTYVYKEPVKLPMGTLIKLTAFYDNSAENPNQPNHPPKVVRWGEQTTDEMCLAFLSYVRDDRSLTASQQEEERRLLSPVIKMGGVNLVDQVRLKLQSALYSTSPVEMYNFSSGFSRAELLKMPWKELFGESPKPSCH
ncbi:MAG: ascorbate-dependent monooxygenase [Acidobacteriota bacterium]|nr:ascorbate-dependent monooxygenase [Blastocatellia bacterium]MDW8413787.1 ascorbate-dependent monooxygenase [Acidobacteriota bacterium]